ncbi:MULTISPECIES: flagellar biosynthesis protein FlhB [Pseudomonas]|uniref:Flagellar biosynthetic protein FlhB n=1 Tax=Pseudomonas flexibilis TaxID=706570 RepID=A0A0B2D7N6_9PSED|nr:MULTISPECIES: flagellar biosynthesis protein FlhB [Pseudomonas]KHL70648.1 flagellar biosynthesis protein FlhB [Pseudomonas flexibilis]KHO66164.1 flagellar biosynthesis protein FlhB [Pseudomonas flexibilis]SCY45219.1 flagellar biosynthetic protein FlhB [Pseudomonas flexibilis]SIR14267.1 flagellar biosynthetic protein FlhB [Pseudomonas flexibilis]
MAENENGADKSEQPTEKRLSDARKKGQIARSKELNTLVVMLAGAGGLMAFGASLGLGILDVMNGSFSVRRDSLYHTDSMVLLLLTAGEHALMSLLPLLILLLLASIVGPVMLGGFLFSTESLMPKFSRMNPLSGLKRMFSKTSLVELFKAIGKFLVVLAVALVVLNLYQDDILALAHQPLEAAILNTILIVGWCALWLSLGLIFIALIDVPYQIWDHTQKMMMTKQEVRDEYKDSEGKPEVKSRIRQLQREISQRRMMAEVPKADVIITNPTHFAVALKYDESQAGAPLLLAKGVDQIALKIREIGNEHKVTVVESPALARAVYYSTELEQEIPAGLYMAVAQVLAYVYQIRQHQAGQGKKPGPLPDLPIPDELRRDN